MSGFFFILAVAGVISLAACLIRREARRRPFLPEATELGIDEEADPPCLCRASADRRALRAGPPSAMPRAGGLS